MSVARLSIGCSRSCVLYCWASCILRRLQESSGGYVGADVSADALTLNHCIAFYTMQCGVPCSARIDSCRARVI